jgi:hypothetical protein
MFYKTIIIQNLHQLALRHEEDEKTKRPLACRLSNLTKQKRNLETDTMHVFPRIQYIVVVKACEKDVYYICREVCGGIYFTNFSFT